MMKKTCFIMLQFKIGGCERVFCSLASMLPETVYLFTVSENYDVEMYNKLPSNVVFLSPIHIKWIDKLIRFQKVPFLSPLIRIIILFAEFLFLRQKFKGQNMNFINFSDTLSTLFLTVLVSNKKRCISWVHCNPNMLKKSICYKLYEYLLCKCRNIVCICEEQRQILLQNIGNLNPHNVYVSYNPINIEQIIQEASKEMPINIPYLLMVARIDLRSKDFYTLIDAYAALPIEMRNSFPLYLIGDGPDWQNVKSYIDAQKLSDNVIMYGQECNPYRWMKHCKLFIFSSKNEGLPTVLLEAMVCGALIISTDCLTGPKEILQNGKNGILVPVGDVERMKEALIYALSSDFDNQYLLNNARIRIRDFSFSSVYSHLLDLKIFQ